MNETPINKEIVKAKVEGLGIKHIGKASIRELVKLVNEIEEATGKKYIRMEMGVPGLPPSKIGVEAEIAALKQGVAAIYPNIEGVDELKDEMSRFVKLFLNIDIAPEYCVPTVGSMTGSFAAFMTVTRMYSMERYNCVY